MTVPPLPADYAQVLTDLKTRIRSAQARAGLSVNRELVLLYWHIGRQILKSQKRKGWGAKVIDRLSRDLTHEFPDMKGFSPRNLKYMRAFAEAWPEEPIVQQLAAQLPWFHNCVLLDKVSGADERLWYVRAAIEHGWSRNVLVIQIESELYQRQGKALTNFRRALPPPQSDLAQQTLKDPYVFDFLTIDNKARERDLEQGLVDHIQRFLLELGVGFAFVGRQIRLAVGGEDFYLDLLFYHLRLRCYVLVELKAVPFQPEFAGKMNFYLSAIDAQLRHEDDRPSIGLLLCKSKNRVLVEYALRDVRKPIGVAAWKTRLVRSLPRELKGSLPTIKELETELRRRNPASPLTAGSAPKTARGSA
jgi:predicted nuclease of restriction endonuclease-like (RecB) superfamily